MSSEFDFVAVDRFTVGTIGMPGDRTFYFQLAVGRQVLSFRCEKGQVAALADAIGRLLTDLPDAPTEDVPAAGLDLPLLEEWPIGTMGLAWDGTADRIVVVLEELQRNPEIPATGKAQVRLTRSQAVAVAAQGMQLVAAGRPLCQYCGAPIDPDGFNCSCNN